MAPSILPPLPTMGVGSYALPGWMQLFRRHMRDQAGPVDIAEAFEDATRLAIADQVEAGLDIISDGELRRQRFVYEMYDRIDGLRRLPRGRRLGVPGYDMAPSFLADEKIGGSGDLGLVEEFRLLQRLAPDRHLKIAFPGPLTFAANIAPGVAYGDGPAAVTALMRDIAELVAAEIDALATAGATHIQLDEPRLTNLPSNVALDEAAGWINRAIGRHRAITSVHVCYGNNASRPMAERSMHRLMDAMTALDTDLLVLEFANREMAEVDRLAELAPRYRIAAGVVDVKSFYEETADDVAARIRRVLAHVPADRLMLTADCGFSAIPRWLARRKMDALVAGTRLVRSSLH